MTPLRPHDLLRPGATIRCRTAGRADAPAAVLLHGAALDHDAWLPRIDALPDRVHLVSSGSSSSSARVELYRSYGARPWHLLQEAARGHRREPVAVATDGRGRPVLPAVG